MPKKKEHGGKRDQDGGSGGGRKKVDNRVVSKQKGRGAGEGLKKLKQMWSMVHDQRGKTIKQEKMVGREGSRDEKKERRERRE